MPTPYIKKLHEQGKGSVAKLEKKWKEAEAQAEKQGKGKNYAYITTIFKSMVHASPLSERFIQAKLAVTDLGVSWFLQAEEQDWFHEMDPSDQKQYVKEHPRSKYADQVSKSNPVGERRAPRKEHRKDAADLIRNNVPKIKARLTKNYPGLSKAVGVLKKLKSGKSIDKDEKENLYELGEKVIHAAMYHSGHIGYTVHAIAHLGITSIKYAIEKVKEHKEGETIDNFINDIGEGIEKSEVKPEGKISKTQKHKIIKVLKSSKEHVLKAIDKSFPDTVNAMRGLKTLTQGGKLTPEHKKSLKELGRFALGAAVITLPGGIAAHITANVAISATNYAVNALRKDAPKKKLLTHFVDALNEGVERAIVEDD